MFDIDIQKQYTDDSKSEKAWYVYFKSGVLS